MPTIFKKEAFLIAAFILFFVLIRSLHFPYYLNFSQEQAAGSLKAYQLWQEKKIELAGPPISWRLEGRYIFQSSIAYYFTWLFLVPTQFDPIAASYLYVLFAAVSLIPLWFGVKWLISRQMALLMGILYAFLPFYIDFSRFFWNPNFQLGLAPYLLFFMGLYKKQKKPLWLFLVGLSAGVILLFHYQFVLVVLALLFYYLVKVKENRAVIFILIFGLVVGISPMLLFELRHDFYDVKTIFLFMQNFGSVVSPKNSPVSQHYLLTTSFFAVLAVASWFRKKLSTAFVGTVGLGLALYSFFLYLPQPSKAYGMARNWNVLYEKKAAAIIKKENLDNYNVVNLGYDNIAIVPKYLLTIEGVKQNFDDYYHNQYLFIITPKENFYDHAPYEVANFQPSRLLKKWPINNTYTMYLLERKTDDNAAKE